MDWKKERAIEYIKNNLNLIDFNNFTDFYNKVAWEYRGDVTSLLLEANINPLLYMDNVPGSYLFNQRDIKSINIPDNIKSIGYNAFSDCTSLTSVTIGDNVTSIDYGAFKGCTLLKNINYSGNKNQWNAIDIDSGWNKDSSLKTIHCTDGDIKL